MLYPGGAREVGVDLLGMYAAAGRAKTGMRRANMCDDVEALDFGGENAKKP